ncbi:hypothetical protein HFO98_33490 [Rhizobium leguminosarum]|nr:hypothetical protein [Rhizobium leguminosarum]MBY5413246.1 hypothetical protein [Rhizobium leguminosarum]
MTIVRIVGSPKPDWFAASVYGSGEFGENATPISVILGLEPRIYARC